MKCDKWEGQSEGAGGLSQASGVRAVFGPGLEQSEPRVSSVQFWTWRVRSWRSNLGSGGGVGKSKVRESLSFQRKFSVIGRRWEGW